MTRCSDIVMGVRSFRLVTETENSDEADSWCNRSRSGARPRGISDQRANTDCRTGAELAAGGSVSRLREGAHRTGIGCRAPAHDNGESGGPAEHGEALRRGRLQAVSGEDAGRGAGRGAPQADRESRGE